MVNKITELMKVNYGVLINLIELKDKKNKTNNKIDYYKYNSAFNKAMSRFGYIVDIHSSKYKAFMNYQDIYQEGRIGLAIAIDRFDPRRSKNFFKIANWYVKTRIKRSANKHCVVSIPLASKERLTINRTQDFSFIESEEDIMSIFEKEDFFQKLQEVVLSLEEPYKTIICLYYGLYKNKEKISTNKIAKVLKMEKEEVESLLEEAYKQLSCNELLNSNES